MLARFSWERVAQDSQLPQLRDQVSPVPRLEPRTREKGRLEAPDRVGPREQVVSYLAPVYDGAIRIWEPHVGPTLVSARLMPAIYQGSGQDRALPGTGVPTLHERSPRSRMND